MKTSIIPALLAVTLAPACTDADPTDDQDETPLSSTEQDIVTEINGNTCATGDALNAAGPTLYLGTAWNVDRSSNNINNTCDCKAWEVENATDSTAHANHDHPKCRPGTAVGFIGSSQSQTGYIAGVRVNSWNFDNPDTQTECGNSLVHFELQDNLGNVIYQRNVTPSFSTTTGVCSGVSFGTPQGLIFSAGYTIKAYARRGLPQFGHGYETLQLWATSD